MKRLVVLAWEGQETLPPWEDALALPSLDSSSYRAAVELFEHWLLVEELTCGYGCRVRDPSWIKSRIAARLLLRSRRGVLRERDRRLAQRLADDPAVTDRLIDQALASICAENGAVGADSYALVRATVAARA